MRRLPFRKSLAFRLLLISFILLALPLLVDSFVIIQNTYKDAIQDAKELLVEVTTTRELPIAELQPAKRATLVLLEAFLNLRDHFPTESDAKLDAKLHDLAEAGGFYGMFLLKRTEEDRYVVVAASDPQYEKKDYTQFIQLIEVYSPESLRLGYFNFLSYDSTSFQPYFLVGRVIYSPEGVPAGLLIVTSNITEGIKRLLASETEYYQVNFALLLPNTIVFASSDPALQFQYFAPIDPEFRKIFIEEELFSSQTLPKTAIKKTSLGYPFFEFTWQGEAQIGYVKKLSTSSISLLAYASKKAIFTHPFLTFVDVYTMYLLILIVGGGIAFVLTKRLSRPMFHWSEVLNEIQQGNLHARYQSDPLGYEINTVGATFNEMIETLLQKQTLAQEERIARETYSQELRIGQQVQRSLLPGKMPNYPGVDLAERYIPAKEVGGDFFDVFVKTTEKEQILALAIADASGKGVTACFYSLGVRNMLRTYAKECDDVGQVMKKTNALFCQDTADTGMFVTVLMGYYNYRTQELSYYSCGHNPALLRRANGEIAILNHLGMAMGLSDLGETIPKKVNLEKGDLVLFYTDGITEAHDRHFHMFSEERLIRFLKEEGDKKAGEVADKLLEELHMFVGDAPQHDDITLLIMKVI